MTKRFKGKTAVFTGAGRGIGAALCAAFALEGARVAALDIDADGVQAAAQAIREAGGHAQGYELDVTDGAAVNRVADRVAEELGSIDIWFNCAGVSYIVPFLDSTEAIWDKTLSINLKGTYLCCQAAVRHMLNQGKGGAIVNLSSQSGKRAGAQYAAYCASKAGIIGLTQSIALEFARDGIRANAICPGVIETPMWDAQRADYAKKRGIKPDEVMDYFRKSIPLGRLGTYEDAASLAFFLASDASSYMTGQALNLTGGSIMY